MNNKIYQKHQDLSGIELNDLVRVSCQTSSNYFGWKGDWKLAMNETVGKVYRVNAIYFDGQGIELSNGFLYPFFVLEKLPSETKVELNQIDPVTWLPIYAIIDNANEQVCIYDEKNNNPIVALGFSNIEKIKNHIIYENLTSKW